MNNFISIVRMILSKGRSPENNMEQGGFSPSVATTLPVQEAPSPHVDFAQRPDLAPEDRQRLQLFRHLAGIISSSDFNERRGLRVATNKGIYARVVENEMTAKTGYKYFSILINGCLGLQIIVAAALTAMGAGGASRSAVTVFGAINTAIAGILTFLKGSGLPNRLKYYELEWRRVREYIEQRERDFGRPNCQLGLYGVVDKIEKLYEDVKIDLEASTPDRFAGFSSTRRNMEKQTEAPTSTSHPPATAEPLNEKSLESGFGRLKGMAASAQHLYRDHREHFSEDANRAAREYSSHIDQKEKSVSEGLKEGWKEFTADIRREEREAEEAARGLKDRQRSGIVDLVKDAREYGKGIEHAVSERLKGPVTVQISGSTAAPTSGASAGH